MLFGILDHSRIAKVYVKMPSCRRAVARNTDAYKPPHPAGGRSRQTPMPTKKALLAEGLLPRKLSPLPRSSTFLQPRIPRKWLNAINYNLSHQIMPWINQAIKLAGDYD